MTLYLSNRDGDGKTSEEGHFRLQTQILAGDTLGTTSMLVTQNSPVGLSVLVSPGDFKVDTSLGYSYTGWNTSNKTVPISTADPANPRLTTIVAYVDKNASTAPIPPNNPDIIKLAAVNGAPNAIPVAPTGTTIQTQIGAGNPYIILADVRVNAGATSVSNANITDRRNLLRIADNVVKTNSLENQAVTSAKIANSGVVTINIADLNVTTAKLANNAVTAAKIETQQAWIVPALQNGWTAYDINSFPPGRYMKDSMGFVRLGGLIKGGTAPSIIVMTLPVGYRPARNLHVIVPSNNSISQIQIISNGQVQIQTGSTAWVALDGISFRAEQQYCYNSKRTKGKINNDSISQ